MMTHLLTSVLLRLVQQKWDWMVMYPNKSLVTVTTQPLMATYDLHITSHMAQM